MKFKWNTGERLGGGRWAAISNGLDDCLPSAGYFVKHDGYYPFHYGKRYENEEDARRACERYLVRQLRDLSDDLRNEAELIMSK